MSVTLKNVTDIYFDFGKVSDNLLPKSDIVNYGYEWIHEDSLFINGTQHGDYAGDIVYMSNARALKDAYPFLETFSSSFGFEQTYIPGDIEINTRDMYEKVVTLLEDIVHLQDYIVYDEDHLSNMELEMQMESVDEFLDRHYGKLDRLNLLIGEEKVKESLWEVIRNLNSDDELFHNEHNNIWFDSKKAIEMLKEYLSEEIEVRTRYVSSLLLSDHFLMGYRYGVGLDDAINDFFDWLRIEERTFEHNGRVSTANVDGMTESMTVARFTQYIKSKDVNNGD